MKHLLVFFVLLFTGFSAGAQVIWSSVYFDDTLSQDYKILIDTANAGNSWQIGMPQKFLSNNYPYTVSRGIMTDTVNSYPVNDASVFVYKTYVHDVNLFFPMLDFDYRFDSDSLVDYGKLEVSADNGQNWYDALAGNTVLGTSFSVYAMNGSWSYTGPMPDSTALLFTGVTNGWYHFHSEFANVYPIPDTVLFRFSFYSDSVQTNRQGWLIDNFMSGDFFESIATLPAAGVQFIASPNPCSDFVTLQLGNSGKNTIEIFSVDGKKVLQLVTSEASLQLDLHALPAGIYCCRLIGENGECYQQRLLKQ